MCKLGRGVVIEMGDTISKGCHDNHILLAGDPREKASRGYRDAHNSRFPSLREVFAIRSRSSIVEVVSY